MRTGRGTRRASRSLRSAADRRCWAGDAVQGKLSPAMLRDRDTALRQAIIVDVG
jgi:hypothetical protein